ncbi:serine hydrolase [Erythrobacter arachoides]|uniref:Serine hydrolase n=1 Tax=Aurantiacibacter arachoides TaxID=1850444 RepID=A0A845A200_9SPHN|nr:serine hydrolase [Aurantiacibacter arachoides]MXO93166.1 serine hydrolase [Aurantiacibacter arachoides]GGD51511.1 hypothetical protein GCM10011411_09180 [Aurantiacibacter arachoides]
MMFRVLAPLALIATPVAAHAQDVNQRAADIAAVMQGDASYAEVFDAAFTSQIAEPQFRALVDQLESQHGALVGVESIEPISATIANVSLRFERAIAAGVFQLATDPPYRVVGYRITGVTQTDDSAEALLADVQALPGAASILVTPLNGGPPLLSYNADRPLGLGSTFKLYVLSALARQIADGQHSWDEVVPLTVRSYPSGVTQSWPQGAPVTLHTLATLMISISDNTATDQLIAVVGREAVEAEVVASGHADPALLSPFMTTRELFVMKSASAQDRVDLIANYRAGDAATRRQILAGLAGTQRDLAAIEAAFSGNPVAIDVEWLASGQDVTNVMRRLAALDDPTAREIMAVNPAVSPAIASDFSYVGYKGGSEPGVLNMSWLLQDRDGAWKVATLGWNNPDATVDLPAFNALALRAVALAGGE